MTDWASRVLVEVDASIDDLVALLVELVRTPSVGGSDAEHEIQELLRVKLLDAGCEVDHWRLPLDELVSCSDFPGAEVERSEAWGLVGRLPGSGGARSLMLNGHVDVVPAGERSTWAAEPYSGLIERDSLYGRGACDMKGGLVATIFALGALRRVGVPLRGDLLVACVPGEEDGGLGTFAMLKRGWRADLCVIPEPTGLDLVPANAGALTFRLKVRGHATHASRRTEGVSAIEKFLPVWRALERLEHQRNVSPDPLMARWPLAYPLSIGRLSAGDWASTVPGTLVAEGRLGVALDEPVEQARAELEQAVAEACDGDPWLRIHPVRVEWWGGQFAPGRLPAGSDLLDLVAQAHVRSGGRPQETWGGPYGSDLRLLNGMGGIATLHYGPGDARLAHAADESVPLAEVLQVTRTLALLALDVCGPAGEAVPVEDGSCG